MGESMTRLPLAALIVVMVFIWWVGAVTIVTFLIDLAAPKQAPDAVPNFIQEPAGRACEEQHRYDRCEVSYQIHAEKVHFSLPQKVIQAASAATT
jgi:hypothetical protein